MSISAKRKLAVGAAGLAVLVGGGGAYAAGATSGTNAQKPADPAAEQKAFLNDVAKRLNVSRDQLDAAIKGAAEARIDAAVAAGRLTKAQGDEAKKRIASGDLPALGRGLLGGGMKGPNGRGGRWFGHGFGFGGLDGAATYLGLSEEALHQQLASGKSLADIAKAQNKDVAGLKAALKSEASKGLDQGVKEGHLTEAQKTQILSNLDSHLDDLINGKLPSGPRLRWR